MRTSGWKASITALHLEGYEDLTDVKLKKILESFPKLQELHIPDSKNITSVGFQEIGLRNTLRKISVYIQDTASMRAIESIPLQELQIQWQSNLLSVPLDNSNLIVRTVSKIQSLQKLTLVGQGNFAYVKSNAFKDLQLKEFSFVRCLYSICHL